jgi:integrase
MADIETRKSKDGIQERRNIDGTMSYRVQVRLKGFPAQRATFERRTDAKRWKTQTEAALRDGRYFPAKEAQRHTVKELADRYLEIVERKKPYALRKQRAIMEWWKEKLGDYALANVTPALIAKKRDELLQEKIGSTEQPRHRSPSTANRYLAALSKAMSDAVREWHWLHENPVRRVTKESEPQGRVRYLSDDERARLLAACRTSEYRLLYPIVLFALTTGMRRGELLGLRWQDIDLDRRVAVLHNTKNGDRRSVPIVSDVAELLREHGKVRRLDSDLLFAGADGDPVWFEKHWHQALKAAKIKDFRFHDLRHTAASYLAMSGATVPELAAVLGHRTLQMVKRYAHLSDQHTGAVVERMTRKYFG